MKNLICCATIVTAFLLVPPSVKAQGYPYGGTSTTTIYVPPIETTTTTISQVVPTNIYSNNNSFGTSTTTTSFGSTYPLIHQRHQHPQPTVIIQQQNVYPRAVQSSCSTSIIGSPIPSPVGLDRSGQPCR
ncbi:hypothetical protein [Chamaesiphon sp. VAR_48_metabat_135_sub]|uniref:hypothetical protein n=1 Tax=Chamaesiphon sp. VAR_48_metabat_135_sub TaxID=2964699 RepID=UPI00286A4AF4|nr:hypothetical protein [Chamaesiphon sp. VAR_48_metabat_135_sub]